MLCKVSKYYPRNHVLTKTYPEYTKGMESPHQVYGEYSLKEIPRAALPQPDRVHRGQHSYTVKTAVSHDGVMHEVLVDILLRGKAYFIKKAAPQGCCRQISWKKDGGPGPAWSVCMDQARCGSVFQK